MTQPSYPQNNNIPQAQPLGTTPKKSGCGCCGCFFTGCFGFTLLIVGAIIAGYFLMDWGALVDKAAVWTYHTQFRPKVLEPELTKNSPQEKAMALEVFDSYVRAYEALPSEQRKIVRQEILTYIEYQTQNKPVPPEKVVNLMNFVENQMKLLEQKYPQLPKEEIEKLIKPNELPKTL
ncbi:MAG: hypothetical protein JNK65_08905 [Deltaproteobacteria bacterium]|nr:hypothetical protein [Deltaproteobacteria bacterium]